MKKKLTLLGIFLCLILAGCGKNDQTDNGECTDRQQDSQNFSALRDAAATSNGFYSIQDDFIYFTDIQSNQTVPLCGKLNCRHTDSSCNAYFDAPLSVQAYDGAVYVVARGTKTGSVSLYRVSEDGSERKELKVLYTYETDDVSCSLDFMIHRGCGYMVTNWVQKDRTEKEQFLYRISLDSSDKKEQLAGVKGYTPMIYLIEGQGNAIYFSTNRYIDKDSQNLEIKNYKLDIAENTVQEIPLTDGVSLIAVKKNQYFCTGKDGTEIMVFDETGKNEKTLFEWEYGNTVVYHDEKYLYLDNEVYLLLQDKPAKDRRIAIVDYEGNKICEWKTFGEKMLKLLWSDSESLLLQNTEDDSRQLLKLTDISELE